MHPLDLGHLFVFLLLQHVPDLGLLIAHVTDVFAVDSLSDLVVLRVLIVFVDEALTKSDSSLVLRHAWLLHDAFGSRSYDILAYLFHLHDLFLLCFLFVCFSGLFCSLDFSQVDWDVVRVIFGCS